MIDKELHASVSHGGRAIRSAAAGLALLAILGFIAGVFLVIVTDAVERAGIEGAGWSLRGNGALVVPVCSFPAILIAGWALLALWLHADRRSCLGGLGAGIFALLLAGLLSYIGSSWALLSLTLLVAFVMAVLLARGTRQRRTAGWMMAGALVLPVAVCAGVLLSTSEIMPR